MALIHYWTCDNLDTSGSTLIDRAGSNNQTLVNSPQTGVAGHLGQAYLFNSTGAAGVGSSQLCLTAAYVGPSSAQSISLWYKSSALPAAGNFSILACQRVDQSQLPHSDLLYDSSGALFARIIQDSQFTIFIGRDANINTVTLNTWNHLVTTYDGSVNSSGIKIFHNTVQVDSVNDAAGAFVSPSTFAIPFSFGAGGDSQFPVFGAIDEVRQYNHALASSEILELFSDGMQYFQPFSEPKRPSTTVKSDHFTYDWKWLSPIAAKIADIIAWTLESDASWPPL